MEKICIKLNRQRCLIYKILKNFNVSNREKNPFIMPGGFVRRNQQKSKNKEKVENLIDDITSKAQRNVQDDVHSVRFQETFKMDQEIEYFKARSNMYKFTLDNYDGTVKLDLNEINVINIENESSFWKVPKLAHNLDHIVHKPGIYTVEDMAHLQKDGGKFIKKVYHSHELRIDKIPPYAPPSKDENLVKMARESNMKYLMSTSTISSVIIQIFYLFCRFKNPDFNGISNAYDNEPKKYMISQRKPTTNYLTKLDSGLYAFDSDPGIFKHKIEILMDLGKIIERSLTMEEEEFKRVLLKQDHLEYNKENLNQKDQIIVDDHHRYMKLNNNIFLRAQIDCMSIDRQTGKPFVFEIKTRSICPMRYDLENYHEYLDYKITDFRGLHSSYEREYYDLIRGAFLKYAFQLRIGRMDGAFISYHNTQQQFGYEYVKTKEIEKRIFGSEVYAEVSFLVCSKLLSVILDYILKEFEDVPNEQLKIGFYSCSNLKKMFIFVEIMENKQLWGQDHLIAQSEEIKDEYDYYTKYKPLTNRVIKFEFFIYPVVNGVHQKNQNFQFTPHDQIEVNYKFVKIGEANFLDYMNFLHEAYKFETLNLDLSYAGAWINK